VKTKSKYFTPSEFVCNGVSCYDKMNVELLKMLEVARQTAGIPFVITSSWRSEAWNTKINGAKNSAHLRGHAVDIKCTNSMDRFTIVKALLSAGFTRIGIANSFVHADNDPTLASGVIWLY
jgi:zinc D-Ala-D-Ala carboxypeptidase